MLRTKVWPSLSTNETCAASPLRTADAALTTVTSNRYLTPVFPSKSNEKKTVSPEGYGAQYSVQYLSKFM